MRQLCAALVLLGGVVTLSGRAHADWPSGGIRTVSGQWCSTGSVGQTYVGYECPFMSDTADYFAADSSTLYADFVQIHFSNNSIVVSACRQSWEGGSVVCGNGATSTTNGDVDLPVSGFATIPGTAEIYDYFFAEIVPTGPDGGDAIQTMYGIGCEN
jgi:hypothetical protein